MLRLSMIRPFFAMLALTMTLSGCRVNYSFTGASIPPEAKTLNIKHFPNRASLVEPTLSQTFTEALKDKFINETNLTLTNQKGDLILEGAITGYSTQPVAIQGDDQAAINRLTISVLVKYTNTVDEKMSFESSFSRYSDYSSTQNLSAVQEGLIQEITQWLVEDIFNKAVVNW